MGQQHEPVVAYNGTEAVRLFPADERLDVLILDIGLPDSDGRDVCVALRGAGSAPPIAGPLVLVTRALAPLVENAGRHAEKRVTMDLRARDLIEIAVSDDGPGVPPDRRESIFEPGVSTQGSSGLGLGIARRVARSLGGDVVFHGDEFVLRLPRAWTSDTPPGEGRGG